MAAKTERDGAAGSPAETIITLKQADDWFAMTLLVAHSKNYLVGFKWHGNNRVAAILDFGCSPRPTAVGRVGPIEIDCRFDRTVILPEHGYSSFPRDGPRTPCN